MKVSYIKLFLIAAALIILGIGIFMGVKAGKGVVNEATEDGSTLIDMFETSMTLEDK